MEHFHMVTFRKHFIYLFIYFYNSNTLLVKLLWLTKAMHVEIIPRNVFRDNCFQPVLFIYSYFVSDEKNETEKYYKILYLLNRPEDIITKLQTDSFTAVKF